MTDEIITKDCYSVTYVTWQLGISENTIMYSYELASIYSRVQSGKPNEILLFVTTLSIFQGKDLEKLEKFYERIPMLTKIN